MQSVSAGLSHANRPTLEWFASVLTGDELPSRALEDARHAGKLVEFPELLALVGVPQDPIWHPEGDVWRHTMMVVDEAWKLSKAASLPPDRSLQLLLGALTHDFGKPEVTSDKSGRWRAIGHEEAGVAPAHAFLTRLGVDAKSIAIVEAIVAHHMMPAYLHTEWTVRNQINERSYEKAIQRLMRKVPDGGWEVFLLACEADHRGRGTPEASQPVFAWQKAAGAVTPSMLPAKPLPALIDGADLVALGFTPGPEFGKLIRRFSDLDSATPSSLEALSREIEERRRVSESADLRTAPPLRVESDERGVPHPHATTRYERLASVDCFNAIRELLECKALGYPELNIHLPHEIQYDSHRNLEMGGRFMHFVERAAEVIGVPVVWENAPILDTEDWKLREQCTFVPNCHALCLDIGHLMLGASDRAEALARIDSFMKLHGDRVKHLHLHINDFAHDSHDNDRGHVVDFLGEERFERLTRGRSFIFERGA